MKYSLGVDLGTTTAAGILIDAERNIYPPKTLLNFQYPECGIDSIKRIQCGLDKNSVKKLRQKSILTINALIDAYRNELWFDYGDIVEVAVAGNTVMEMALCGYPLISLSKPPYRPDADIFFPQNTNYFEDFYPKNKNLFIFPVLDGFVGGDTVASLYYLDIIKKDKPVFFADFGTNVEIAVGYKNKIFTTSAPAGPAFEGGNIKSGMTALDGAIYDVILENGIFKFKTVNDSVPAGICGSGIMSLVYELLKEGVIDKSGMILSPEQIESESFSVVKKKENENEIILYFDEKKNIKFYQEDIRQFQFAKSAVKSASEILLEKFKISEFEDFDVYISGTFGSNIKPDIIDLIDIFPFKGKKINFINGAVIQGCHKYIISNSFERETDIKNIIKISKNFPLSGSKFFEKHFIKNISFLF